MKFKNYFIIIRGPAGIGKPPSERDYPKKYRDITSHLVKF